MNRVFVFSLITVEFKLWLEYLGTACSGDISSSLFP